MISVMRFLTLVTCVFGIRYVYADSPTIDDPLSELRAAFNLPDDNKTLCDDRTFIRRAYLDVTGYPPTIEEQRDFLASSEANKRAILIDRLLDSQRFSENWGRWLTFEMGADEAELVYAAQELGMTERHLLYGWIRWTQNHLKHNTPYNEIARHLLNATSRGENSGNNYYRWLQTIRNTAQHDGFQAAAMYVDQPNMDLFWRSYSQIYSPDTRGEEVAERFMGITLECARCHDHPFESLSQSDHSGFAAIFRPIRYSELPITFQQKRFFTIATAAALAIFGLVTAWLASVGRKRKWLLVLRDLCFVLIGFGLVVLSSYLHLVPSLVSKRVSPGLVLDDLSQSSFGPAFFILGALAVSVVLFSITIARAVRSWAITRVSLAVLFGFSSLTVADWMLVHSQSISGKNQESLVHLSQRQLLAGIGLGGSGHQPREVFVAEQAPNEIPPRLLNGEQLQVDQGSNPIRAFSDWLTRVEPDLLAINIVQRTWEEYFWHVAPDQVDKSLLERDKVIDSIIHHLARELIEDNWSLKALHRKILNSRQYQLPRAVNSESDTNPLFYNQPRRLNAEQFVVAVEALRGWPMPPDERYSPPSASVFQNASKTPWSNDFRGRVLRLLRHERGSRQYRQESALLLLVDTTWLDDLEKSWFNSQEFIDQPRKQKIQHLYETAYTRSASEQELAAIEQELSDIQSDAEAIRELMWAIANSTEFQFIL